MPLLSNNALPRLYDCAIDGVGYMLAYEVDRELLSPWKQAFLMHAEDIYVEKRDNQVEEMTENKLDRYYWRSQRSWDYGAGQLRFEVNLPGFPASRAFLDSQGIDVFTNAGQATLLPVTNKILALTNQGPSAPQKMSVTDSYVYVASGQPNLQRFTKLDASDAAAVSTATETAQQTFDLATDGSIVYVALGPDGIHKNTTPVDTQRESFDTSAGYTTVNAPVLTTDAVDFKEGTGSLQVVSAAGTSTETKALTGAPLNFSTVDLFKIWLKQVPPATAAPTLQQTVFNQSDSSLSTLPFALTNVAVNDLVVIELSYVPGTTYTMPTGFTNAGQSSANNVVTSVWYHLATAADGTTPTFSVAGIAGNVMVGMCRAWRGVDTANPLPWGTEVSLGFANSGSTNVNVAAFTTTKNNNIISFVVGAQRNVAGAAPAITTTDASWTTDDGSISGGGAFFSIHGWHKTQVTAGTVAATSAQTNIQSGIAAAQYSIRAAPGPAQALSIRLETSTGNYFQRTVTPATGSWVRDTSTRIGDWTTVGAPNWATINNITLVQPGANTVHYDDFVSSSSATFAHFSDPDYRALGWAKDRLYGAGIKTGTQWAFREVGAGATSKEWLVLPDGYSVTDIQELGPYVYFTANRASVSKIYAFDGVNTPFVALTMPSGETATKLQPFLGAGFLIGARRVGTMSPNAGPGVLYRAFPQGAGHLTSERISQPVFGADDGKDYAPQAGTSYLDEAFIGRNFADSAYSGLTAYYPATGGFARHVEGLVQGVVASAGIFKNKKIFTVDGFGVYAESITGQLVTGGTLTSSVMDWNIDSAKVLMKGELATMPLPAGSSARLDFSIDQGKTFSTLASSSTTGATLVTAPLAQTNTSAQVAQTRITLTPDTTGLISPILKKAGLAAIYGIKPRRTYQVAIKAYSYMQLRNGTPHPQQGPGLPKTIESTLQSLRDTQKIVQFQPPGWGEEQQSDNPNVRVGMLKTHRTWIAESGFAQICLVELFEVPS